MKRVAVFAILAIVMAMVPMTTASSQPTPGSLDGVGTLMIMNTGEAGPVDLWIEIEDGEFQELQLASPSQQEFQIPDGTHAFQVCGPASDDETCAGDPYGLAPGSVEVDENDIINFLVALGYPTVDATGTYIAENETEKTESENAALTVHNTTGAPIDVCVDGEHVNSTPGGAPSSDYGEFNAQDAEGLPVLIYIGTFAAYGSVCGGGEGIAPPAGPIAIELIFAPGSNTVSNIPGFLGLCGGDCAYQIFPGEEPPGSDQLVDEFCAVVLEAANITPWLQELFDEVEVGNEDTYPDPDDVEVVLVRIAELLEKGNETAPDDIIDVWLRATAGFVRTGQLAGLDYDIAALSQSSLRTLIDSTEHPGADDSEEAADTAAITAWVTTNCFGAIEAQPSFTG